MKKQVIRIGDTVRIVNSKAVRRVGYPLVWFDLMHEVEEDPLTRQAYNLLAGPQETVQGGPFANITVKDFELPRYFLKACAMLKVEQRRFGGNTRSLHYYTLAPKGECFVTDTHAPDMTGEVHEVHSKRVVKTGTRFAPRSGVTHTYDGPDYWDEPGGLDDMQTHVLLMLQGYEFEQCNVELVKRAPKPSTVKE